MNGIGGRTIAEAQERMTYPEFIVWCKYRRKRGSLNTGMRVEIAAASQTAVWANSKTKEGAQRLHAEDFAPHMDPRIITIEEAMGSWD
ncbi:hypothetical protein Psp6_00057 [Pseudomonas phage Psp6]|nr:hypothetical protein Psp6_00057 [Pseudomonas phage Psp6]